MSAKPGKPAELHSIRWFWNLAAAIRGNRLFPWQSVFKGLAGQIVKL